MAEFTMANVLAEMPECKGNARSLYFRQSAYNRWAVKELFKFIDKHPEWPTLTAIDKFMALMDKYIENSVSDEMRWVFCVARDEAAYMYDWYVAEEIRGREEKVCSKQFGSIPVTMDC